MLWVIKCDLACFLAGFLLSGYIRTASLILLWFLPYNARNILLFDFFRVLIFVFLLIFIGSIQKKENE